MASTSWHRVFLAVRPRCAVVRPVSWFMGASNASGAAGDNEVMYYGGNGTACARAVVRPDKAGARRAWAGVGGARGEHTWTPRRAKGQGENLIRSPHSARL